MIDLSSWSNYLIKKCNKIYLHPNILKLESLNHVEKKKKYFNTFLFRGEFCDISCEEKTGERVTNPHFGGKKST